MRLLVVEIPSVNTPRGKGVRVAIDFKVMPRIGECIVLGEDVTLKVVDVYHSPWVEHQAAIISVTR